ncbi:MAG: PTS transporter subunit IIC [Sarcina sp.]
MKSREYIMNRIFKGSAGLAQGIFVTLGIGLLLENIGKITNIPVLVIIGTVTKTLMSPAIGAGIAFALGANALTIFSAMAASTLGAAAINVVTTGGLLIKSGEPIGAVLAGIVATYIGKRILGKTKVDMMIVPLASVLLGGLFGYYVSKIITPVLNYIGGTITNATQSSLLLSSIVIAILWGILIMSPASSVALAVALSLNPEASAAALVGCTAQFVGFTIMSLKENDIGGIMAIFLCTPKIQLPNVTKNLKLMIPTLIASAIASPIAVIFLGLRANSTIAGMGLSSFVAPINILSNEGLNALILGFILGCVIIPSIISYIIYEFMKNRGLIKIGDLKLPQ